MSKLTVNVPLNRVEGDLEVRAEIVDGRVSEAWACGSLYRGFERILVGRGALDGLVITPRICGLCTTAHLMAAARVLDAIAGAAPPASAVAIRNVALMTEHVQSDLRQTFLMFAADLVNPAYAKDSLFEEAVRRYEPFRGETAIETIRETKKVLEILAIVGGQWPHSSFIVPGGLVSISSPGDLLQCRLLLRHFRQWYERRVLGCRVERWAAVRSAADLEEWLEENEAHRNGDLGFFLRFGRAIGLDRIGRGAGSFLSVGSLDLPRGTAVRAPAGGGQLVPAGFLPSGCGATGFDQGKVAEHVARSWFEDSDGARHPMRGETRPYATGQEGGKYSWAKAPRYDGRPAETGPLAEALIAGNPLFSGLVRAGGPSVLVRQLARLARPAEMMPAMETWLSEAAEDPTFYKSPGDITDGEGYGLIEATRGALGHWVR
ncbi:MAG: nickel-dependent hydrogenase large subunit, partial [Acidobacteriota bacterium]|nr:nickel-dependent hydrogenase large subunit [Acidobacteriota bacterium]